MPIERPNIYTRAPSIPQPEQVVTLFHEHPDIGLTVALMAMVPVAGVGPMRPRADHASVLILHQHIAMFERACQERIHGQADRETDGPSKAYRVTNRLMATD